MSWVRILPPLPTSPPYAHAPIAQLVERIHGKDEVTSSSLVGSSRGRLAQLGEHLPYKQGVGGSSPSTPIILQVPKSLVPQGILLLRDRGLSSNEIRFERMVRGRWGPREGSAVIHRPLRRAAFECIEACGIRFCEDGWDGFCERSLLHHHEPLCGMGLLSIKKDFTPC